MSTVAQANNFSWQRVRGTKRQIPPYIIEGTRPDAATSSSPSPSQGSSSENSFSWVQSCLVLTPDAQVAPWLHGNSQSVRINPCNWVAKTVSLLWRSARDGARSVATLFLVKITIDLSQSNRRITVKVASRCKAVRGKCTDDCTIETNCPSSCVQFSLIKAISFGFGN